jgi:hypothetical protein
MTDECGTTDPLGSAGGGGSDTLPVRKLPSRLSPYQRQTDAEVYLNSSHQITGSFKLRGR